MGCSRIALCGDAPFILCEYSTDSKLTQHLDLPKAYTLNSVCDWLAYFCSTRTHLFNGPLWISSSSTNRLRPSFYRLRFCDSSRRLTSTILGAGSNFPAAELIPPTDSDRVVFEWTAVETDASPSV